jgi:hypothetical protein
MVTAEEVRRCFSLDPEEGLLRWAVRRKPIRLGDVAGWVAKDGRRRIGLAKGTFLVHRLIWLHFYGEWPEHEIDHINGDVTDNRIANLRDVPHNINCENKRRPTRANALGVQGVVRDDRGKYVASITTMGVGRRLGSFATAEEASAAYLQAKRVAHAGCTL